MKTSTTTKTATPAGGTTEDLLTNIARECDSVEAFANDIHLMGAVLEALVHACERALDPGEPGPVIDWHAMGHLVSEGKTAYGRVHGGLTEIALAAQEREDSK